nr:AAA family ATPase [Brachybacterium sacelli]
MVARIGPAAQGGAQAEVERALCLAEVGAPVGALDPRTPPQVQRRDGFEITLWTHHAPDEYRVLPAAEYAAALTQLHAGMRAVDLELPHFTERVASALALLDDPGLTPGLAGPDRTFLRETIADLSAEIAGRGGQQFLHGEPHPGNVLETADGPLFIDLETCCIGPVEFDLAHAPAQVAAHYPAVDAALLEDCRILTRALATTWRWDREDDLPEGKLLGIGWLQQVRALMTHRRRPDAPRPTLTILCGLPGSGKTTEADRIVEATGAFRLSPDDWLELLDVSLWQEELRDRIEQLQWQIGRELLAQGVSVVVEWGTWGREERDQLRTEARALGARVALRFLDADDEELLRRASARRREEPPMLREHFTEYRTKLQVPTAEELALYDQY